MRVRVPLHHTSPSTRRSAVSLLRSGRRGSPQSETVGRGPSLPSVSALHRAIHRVIHRVDGGNAGAETEHRIDRRSAWAASEAPALAGHLLFHPPYHPAHHPAWKMGMKAGGSGHTPVARFRLASEFRPRTVSTRSRWNGVPRRRLQGGSLGWFLGHLFPRARKRGSVI